MIPPILGEECTSPGEKEVFHRLSNDPDTKEWTILHSLDISNHRKQLAGEIDFVIVVPGKGVLCVEVKAHHSIRRVDGLWYFGNNTAPDHRGPFKQVSAAMHSLRDWVAAKRDDLSNLPFWSAVVFPYVDFRVQSDEWHDWQLIDGAAFRSRPLAKSLAAVLIRGRQHLLNHNAAWFTDDSRPTEDQCQSLTHLLRPNFEFFESPRTRVKALDAQAKHYTQEQFRALDALQGNARIIFEGPAGTGKTLLAIEAARRSAASGKRVLLLCFNNLLGHWLSAQAEELRPLVATSTLHKQMLAVAGVTLSGSVSAHFWDRDLPEVAVDRLLTRASGDSYDEIIVDEAQDIIRPAYLDFLDLSVSGGMSAGTWKMFGDFEKQAIYETSTTNMGLLLRERAPSATRFGLRINCRNTPRIAEFVHLLGGLAPNYASVLRPDDGVDPRVEFYRTGEKQADLLRVELERLTKQGFRNSDIVVLSPLAKGSCATGLNTGSWAGKLKPMSDQSSASGIGFCTIHAYKGLEAKAVVLTDIDEIDTPAAMALFYVGITRALHSLTILAHERVKEQARNKIFNSPGAAK